MDYYQTIVYVTYKTTRFPHDSLIAITTFYSGVEMVWMVVVVVMVVKPTNDTQSVINILEHLRILSGCLILDNNTKDKISTILTPGLSHSLNEFHSRENWI